jgi:polyribonucleotide 5'-hydroxyl-kinase
MRGAPLWRKLVTAMGEAWAERWKKDAALAMSGLFIDAPSGFITASLGQQKGETQRYPLLLHAVDTFEVDLVVVIGSEKVTIDLQRVLDSRGVKVIQLPKSSGVVDVEDSYREIVHAQQVRSYFYGEPALPSDLSQLVGRTVPLGLQLSPYSFQIGWDILHVLRVGEGSAAPSTALPLGSSHILSPTRLTRVDPAGPAHTVRLLNTVLAIVAITPEDKIAPAPKEEEGQEAKPEATEEVKAEDGEDAADEVAGKVEEDEDEVPFREEIGWREVLGFVVM